MPRSALDERIEQYLVEKAKGKFVKPTSEQRVEEHLRDRVHDLGGTAYKFTSPGRAGVPDRLNLFPIPPEHREIVARYVRLVETKKRGKKPRPEQLAEHKHLRDMGFRVDVIDTKAGVDAQYPAPKKD